MVLLGQKFIDVVHVGLFPELVIAELSHSGLLVEDIVLRLLNATILNVFKEVSGRLASRLTVLSGGSLLLVKAREHVLDSLVVVIEGVGLDDYRLSDLIRLLELAVPSALDASNLLVAEVEPALHAGALLNRVLVVAAVHVIEGGLGRVTKLKSDLDDLSEVHARCNLA